MKLRLPLAKRTWRRNRFVRLLLCVRTVITFASNGPQNVIFNGSRTTPLRLIGSQDQFFIFTTCTSYFQSMCFACNCCFLGALYWGGWTSSPQGTLTEGLVGARASSRRYSDARTETMRPPAYQLPSYKTKGKGVGNKKVPNNPPLFS